MRLNVDFKPIVLVVDAYSTGKYLPDALIQRGYSWVHIVSRRSLPDFLVSSVSHNSCIEEIHYDGDFEGLVHGLGRYGIIAVLAGAETSIELTEQLSWALGLFGNNPGSSMLRRNKYHMVEAIRKAGLLCARQLLSNDVESILNWYDTEFLAGETIVIKPVNSAGTDSVTFCSSPSDIEHAVHQILGCQNKLGLANESVLAQSFLKGTEYVVNTVSFQGKHHLTDIWHCEKQRVEGAGFVPGCETLLESDGDVQRALKAYAFKALDALQFTQGPAHFEIMLTEAGPCIIEVGARIQGGVDPQVHVECMGSSQLNKTLDSYFAPEHFLSYWQENYSVKKHARWVDLIVPDSGIIRQFTLMDKVRQLESFYSGNVSIKNGDYLERTVDLYTSPGSIYLVHGNAAQLKRDYVALRNLERDSYEFIAS